jgi:hypothetical protein
MTLGLAGGGTQTSKSVPPAEFYSADVMLLVWAAGWKSAGRTGRKPVVRLALDGLLFNKPR